MSSGQYKKHHGFNPIQIKDGWIVKLYKDGRVRTKIAPWKPGKPKVDKNK